jgi:4-amino-4-deoxy-L-arabinose transferase-like glycosyltransferase
MRPQPLVAASLLAGISLLVAVYYLRTPTPTAQEVTFNMHAQSVLNGKPAMFFHTAGDQWLQPLPVYLNAAVRAVSPRATSGRIVSAIAGSVNVALVVVIVLLITDRIWIAMAAGALLIVTPAHLALAIRGNDAMLLSTLILSWLYGVLRFLKFDSLLNLVVAAVVLGLAVYAHQAGPLTAVFLWLLTLAVANRRNRIRLFTATAVFALMWVPAAAAFSLQPSTYPDTFGRWFVFAAHLRNPLDALLAFINPNTLGNRASMYWGFWDPSWLFFTSSAGPAPLLLIAAPLMVVAIIRWPTHGTRDAAALVIASALIVPLAGASFGVPHYLADAAAVAPILAVLAAVGVNELLRFVVPDRPLEDDVAVTTIE